ncbi:unnamed protein product [Mytilus coruscus]|uniref:Reverse transcriptase domain-containing protein n=1 Tax=Mytilus coruscus TaxID=42192 RepID=A0A6J8EMC3_MYTCO|nr:unnamed protein product [Mytilus coruscus]
MQKMNISGDNWLSFRALYEDLTTKVKWEGNFSRDFKEKQGVRQGGVWSPTAYKVFINSLLKIYEENKIGSCIGTIYCGVPTVADTTNNLPTEVTINNYQDKQSQQLSGQTTIKGQTNQVKQSTDKSDYQQLSTTTDRRTINNYQDKQSTDRSDYQQLSGQTIYRQKEWHDTCFDIVLAVTLVAGYELRGWYDTGFDIVLAVTLLTGYAIRGWYDAGFGIVLAVTLVTGYELKDGWCETCFGIVLAVTHVTGYDLRRWYDTGFDIVLAVTLVTGYDLRGWYDTGFAIVLSVTLVKGYDIRGWYDSGFGIVLAVILVTGYELRGWYDTGFYIVLL